VKSIKNISSLLEVLEEKKHYHNLQLNNCNNELIEKGSAITRINAAKSRERVRTYNEIINLLI